MFCYADLRDSCEILHEWQQLHWDNTVHQHFDIFPHFQKASSESSKLGIL